VKSLVLALSLVMYLLVIALPHKKAWISLGAAGLILAASYAAEAAGAGGGFLGLGEALGELVNWNILMIYVGSLVIADLFIYSMVPAYLADLAVRSAPTIGLAIVAILVMTGLISAFVENVATVLLMAPIAIELTRRLKIDPSPFMIGLAVMANLQGTATLVGDPPSMIFASYAGYSFNDFFFIGGRPSIFFAVQVGMLAGALYLYAFFRRHRRIEIDLGESRIVSLVPTALLLAMIAGLAAISFLSGAGLHASSGLLCLVLALAGLAWYRFARKESWKEVGALVRRLDWETILFLIGVFIVVGAISRIGLIEDLAALASVLIGGDAVLGFLVIVAGSVLISGFVDNVPYIIAMLPVAGSIARELGLAPELYLFGLLVGSCLGGNLTPFGASANVVVVGLLRKEGRRVGFLQWLRVAGPFTLLTTAASALFVFLVWG